MIYLDSCALIKLVRQEAESTALTAHLQAASLLLISSELARTEVHRVLIRDDETAAAKARASKLLTPIARLPLRPIIDSAAILPQRHLRSLDALHVATAQQLGRALKQFITYDRKLIAAARAAGLPVTAPGRNVTEGS